MLVVSCGKGGSSKAQKQAEVFASLQQGVVPARSAVFSDESLPSPCVEFRKEIPESWQQGFLAVPENPAEPEGRKIRIFYYGKIDPVLPPTFFFNGGPSSDSHIAFRRLTAEQPKHEGAEKISFVFIDQRGTGCSDFYPQGTSADVAQRLTHYGSRGIVSDAEHVRRHLIGDRQWIAFGQSYGAFIVHRYFQVAPQSLVSGHAHGNALNADGFERLKMRLASQARVLEEYLKEYPADREVIGVLNRDLVRDRCFKFKEDLESTTPQKEYELCGYDVVSTVVELIGFRSSWKQLHGWLEYFVKDGAIVDEEVIGFLTVFATGEDANPLNSSSFAGKVIGWVDRNTVPFNTFNCQRARNELRPQVNIGQSAFHDCGWAMQEEDELEAAPNPVAFLQRDLLTPVIFRDVIASTSRGPLYWYSGALDSIVPIETYDEELALIKDFENVHYTAFPRSGHDGYRSENKVWDELLKETLR